MSSMILFIKLREQAKLTYCVRSHEFLPLVRGWVVPGKEHKGDFGGTGNILFLDQGPGYTAVFSLWKFI